MRLAVHILTLAAAMAVVPSVSRAADAVPKFNIAANCKAETAGGSSIGETFEARINDEQQARVQLTAQWTQFSNSDKATCIRETSIDRAPSYVEFRPASKCRPT